jgi:hypothetical protein
MDLVFWIRKISLSMTTRGERRQEFSCLCASVLHIKLYIVVYVLTGSKQETYSRRYIRDRAYVTVYSDQYLAISNEYIIFISEERI